MCGITGFISKKSNSNLDLNILINIVNKLSHRGPDDRGYWKNSINTQFLGHTRLSILDLSSNGHQPMASSTNRYIISYNGEIYNHKSIRNEIDLNQKVNWKSDSDTETILESIEKFGINKSIEKFHGMFAFSLIDKKKNILYLVRDKYGEKPLYYGFSGDTFLFSSELKSIVAFPGFEKKINKESLNYFFNFSYIPEPLSIYENINKLEAGSILEFNLTNHKISKNQKFNTILNKQDNFFLNDKNKILENFDYTLNKAVKETMISDVEVGSFLSGGIDSSLITAIMQNQSEKKIKTFSAIFDDKRYNEEFYSRNISKHLGTDHHEILVKYDEVIDKIKHIPEIYDEPFADSSQIPTSLISEFASKNVKVILSGDGADEFFGGYNRYIALKKVNNYSNYLPLNIKKTIGNLINIIPYKYLTKLELFLTNVLRNNRSFNQIDEKLKKLAIVLENGNTSQDMFYSILQIPQKKNSLVRETFNFNSNNLIRDKINSNLLKFDHFLLESMMKIDQETYLTGDILHKVDRASMFYSLETRVPFLNPNVIDFSKNLNINLKIKKNTGKWILKETLKNYIPEKYVDRPKMGFSIPLDEWMKGPLKNWVSNSLNMKKIKNDGYLDEKVINEYMHEHFEGKKNWGQILWNVVVFQNWLDKYHQ